MAKTSTKLICFLGAVALTVSSFSHAVTIIPSPPEVKAKGHILIDFTTGKVISEGNADALEMAAGSKSIMLAGYGGDTNDTIRIWLVDDTLGAVQGVISADDVVQIGILSAQDVDLIDGFNFVV